MTTQPASTWPLISGKTIPQIGLGTWPMDDDQVEVAIVAAVGAGYRLIDSATGYGNEKGVGRGVSAAGVAREELMVTSKVRGRDHGYEATLRAFDGVLDRMGLDYLDLYLIHWPLPTKGLYVDTWRALIKLQEDGRLRSIGVSNFKPAHIERLIAETGVTPDVNQIQLHPAVPQRQTREYNAAHGIVTESWSPLGQGANNMFGDDMNILGEANIAELAAKHGKTPGQIILRWHIELGLVPIPKSSNPKRLAENIDIFDFSLDAQDMDVLAKYDLGPSAAVDSDNHDEE